MTVLKEIIRQPYRVGTLDINIIVSSFNDEKEDISVIGINEEQTRSFIADYFNDLLYNRKMIGSLFITKSNEVFSPDDGLLHLALNFAGKKNDVYYDIKEKRFVVAPDGKEDAPLGFMTPYNLFKSRYFLKMYQEWLRFGITEEDIDIAGDIAGRFQQTLVRSFTNMEMDDNEFKANFNK